MMCRAVAAANLGPQADPSVPARLRLKTSRGRGGEGARMWEVGGQLGKGTKDEKPASDARKKHHPSRIRPKLVLLGSNVEFVSEL